MVYYLQKAFPRSVPVSAEPGTPLQSRAMPWLFVLIWSTGFVVARLAMPHAPPFGFLSCASRLSALCFAVWIALAACRLAARAGRSGATSLVTGVLMQAGYLGGVWAAVKARSRRRHGRRCWSACSRC